MLFWLGGSSVDLLLVVVEMFVYLFVDVGCYVVTYLIYLLLLVCC